MHFEDPFLKEFYFLDIQWIFNTITRIMKMSNINGNILENTSYIHSFYTILSAPTDKINDVNIFLVVNVLLTTV